MRPGLIVSLLATVLIAQPVLAQVRVPGPPRIPAIRTPGLLVQPQSHNDDASCPGNLILNGGFDILTGDPVLTNAGVPIGTAPGWAVGWQGGPLGSRVFSHSAGVTASGQVQPTIPGPGNHLAMYVNPWVTGPSVGDAFFHHKLSDALAQLRLPIPVNSGRFILSFRTSRISPGGPLGVAIYGVRTPAGSAALTAPSASGSTDAYGAAGADNVFLLGYVPISTTARAWQTSTVQFDSHALSNNSALWFDAASGPLTHILIRGTHNSLGSATASSGNAVGFDSFCLRSAAAS